MRGLDCCFESTTHVGIQTLTSFHGEFRNLSMELLGYPYVEGSAV